MDPSCKKPFEGVVLGLPLMSTPAPLAFIDLAAQQARLGERIPQAIAAVLAQGAYIMGPEVATFERQLADFCGARHAVSCANGTDALVLPLMAWGVGPGDAVFVPAFTFIATAEAPALLGATPYFVDVEADTFAINPDSLRQGVADARARGLTPKVVIPVDLFGLPAGYDQLEPLAAELGLILLADAAQGFGGVLDGRRAGRFGSATATSFFPAKPLGCYGDGGAILTDDDALAARLRSLRVHGKGSDKYDNVVVGMNSRLDTLQAAILIEKLAIFAEELDARQQVADRYAALLAPLAEADNGVVLPTIPAGRHSAWAQYTLRLPGHNRDAVAAACKAVGVPTAVYYPIPLHRQSGYQNCPVVPGGCPVSDALARDVLSLPMHPYLSASDQQRVVDALRSAL
jgi:dTDP-4-amino-4,6-dideoxygalactose transaminase